MNLLTRYGHVTNKTAARLLDVHPNTVRAMVLDQRLPAYLLPSGHARILPTGARLICRQCPRTTSFTEAESRQFNQGRCACGGELRAVAPWGPAGT